MEQKKEHWFIDRHMIPCRDDSALPCVLKIYGAHAEYKMAKQGQHVKSIEIEEK